MDGCFPFYAVGLAPSQRQALGIRMPIPSWPAKLRPVLGGRQGPSENHRYQCAGEKSVNHACGTHYKIKGAARARATFGFRVGTPQLINSVWLRLFGGSGKQSEEENVA